MRIIAYANLPPSSMFFPLERRARISFALLHKKAIPKIEMLQYSLHFHDGSICVPIFLLGKNKNQGYRVAVKHERVLKFFIKTVLYKFDVKKLICINSLI